MIELPVDMVNPDGETRSNDLPEAIYFMKLAKKRFSEITSRPYLNGIEVFDTVDFHRAFDGIMETSRKHGCDFIVMGSKGATGFREMFVGSNTEKVVRTSEIPVLVIKKEHENFQIKNIVFATNLDSHNRKTLQKVIDFARLEDARLHLLYINTAHEFITSRQVDEFLEKYVEGLDFTNYEFHVYNDNSVEEGILHFAKSHHADVIGVATHGRRGLAHFLNGSISEDLVNHSTTPIITFRMEKEV